MNKHDVAVIGRGRMKNLTTNGSHYKSMKGRL